LTIAHGVLVVVEGLLPVVGLYLIKLVVDTIEEGIAGVEKDLLVGRVLLLVALSGGVALVGLACTTIAGVVNVDHAQQVTDRTYEILHAKSIEVDLAYYENSRYYDTLHRAQQEAPFRVGRILNGLLQLGQNGISLVAITLILVWFHWSVPIFLVAAAVPGLFIRFRYSRKMYEWQREITPAERRAWYYSSMLTRDIHAKEVRLFNLGSLFAEQFQQLRERLRKQRLALMVKKSLAELGTQGGATAAAYGLYGFLAFRALWGLITLGDLVMFYQAVQRGQSYLRQFMSSMTQLYEDNLFLSDIYEFLAVTPKVVEPAKPKRLAGAFRKGIVFEDVTFQYPGGNRKVLDGVSLTIHPGEHIALIGDNGAGKTTLVKLLCRLYDPTKGKITLDGVDLRDLSTTELRREISVIFQDYARYHMSARDNIWMGNIELSREDKQILEAAREAGADEFIQDLKNGYDTTLGKWFENGEELSIGEWQKIALARAFARRAQIVVLDEPTSSMDARSEWKIFSKFNELTKGRTALLISHRLSTVRMVDRIYVFEDGKLVETGTHNDLLDQRGKYATLFETQAQYYR
jgi:ATP-binding cassette subfamily B protein